MGVIWTFHKATNPLTTPHYAASLGDGRIKATIAKGPQPGGPVLWHVTDLTGGLDKIIASGETDTVDAAKTAAEKAAQTYLRKPGRWPLNGQPMTSTDRNKNRVARLSARAVEADEVMRRLVTLHRDLAAAGLLDWAGRVAGILRVAALRAVAEYTRRNAGFFASTGARLPSPDERSKREKQIVALAEKLDAVAENAENQSAQYGEFHEILGELHNAGFFPASALVDAVAQGYFLAA